MRGKVLFGAAITAICLVAQTVPAAAQQNGAGTSPALVKQLVAAMAARRIEAIAAPDPAEPGRLVAAALIADQMMVISSRHKATDYLTLQIEKKQFREVYDTLQDGIAEGRLFFHDLSCDGFNVKDSLDIFYEGKKDRTILDGNYLGQGLTEIEYADKAKAAEAQYAHALALLLDAVKKLPIIT